MTMRSLNQTFFFWGGGVNFALQTCHPKKMAQVALANVIPSTEKVRPVAFHDVGTQGPYRSWNYVACLEVLLVGKDIPS